MYRFHPGFFEAGGRRGGGGGVLGLLTKGEFYFYTVKVYGLGVGGEGHHLGGGEL